MAVTLGGAVRRGTGLWRPTGTRMMRGGPVGWSGRPRSEGENAVEMAAGLMLILLSLLIIVFVVRTVQANAPK